MVNFDNLKTAMGELDEDTVKEILTEVMADGGTEAAKAMEACQAGMNMVGKSFEEGEYFVGDLIYAGELMKDAVDILKPALVGESESSSGKVILCTVKDDLHDIGKNIVRAMLEASGLTVVDLGIDVAPEVIIDTIKKENIHVVLLSGVLTLAVDSMKDTIDKIKEAGLRDQVKILIGGAPVSEAAKELTGADEWAFNPQKTVEKSREWLEEYAA